MPYYIYDITPGESATAKTTELVSEFDNFKAAKLEAKRMRAEEPPAEGHAYKIIFADNQPEAIQKLTEFREQPIVKEWEK